jgi:hypothetical protein
MNIFLYNDYFLYFEGSLYKFTTPKALKYDFTHLYINKFSDLQYFYKSYYLPYYLRDIVDKYIESIFNKYKFPLVFKIFLDKLNLLGVDKGYFYGPTYYQKIYKFIENNSLYKKYPFLLKVYAFFLRQIEEFNYPSDY